jgi:hypothetical protein
MELRPLGFGEIFDRAITLYLRNVLPFAAIVAVIVVPLAILQYLSDRSAMPQWDYLVKAMQHPGSASVGAVPASTLLSSPQSIAVLLAILAITWLLWPFALNACAVGVAQIYRGLPVDFSVCYKAAFRRWPSVLGLLAIEAAIFIGWYIAFVLALVATTLLTVAMARALPLAGIVGGLLVVAVFVLGLLVLAPLFIALSFAMNAIVIEERPVFEAIGLGFSRIFNKKEVWRSLAFALSAGAIFVGASTVAGVLSIVGVIFHWVALEVFVTSLFRAAIAPFSIVLLAVYYFDVRIRREGLDLESDLERLTAPLVA